MASTNGGWFKFIVFCIVTKLFFNSSLADPTSAICPGACIDIETGCNNAIEDTHCGSEAICCLDNFEFVTEPGFDFSTMQSINDNQWMSEMDSNEQANSDAAEVLETDFSSNNEVFTTVPSSEVYFTTENQGVEEMFTTESPDEQNFEFSSSNDFAQLLTAMPQDSATTMSPEFSEIEQDEVEMIELDHCPGACVPTQHASLCQYIVQSDFCPRDKTCCATKAAAEALNLQRTPETLSEVSFPINECPGKCIHPSVAVFCDNVLEGYQCPMGFACCDSQTARESPVLQCSGECLPPHSTYLCLPPYELTPGTDCEQSVCCMRTGVYDEQEQTQTADRATFSAPQDEVTAAEPTGFASDERGQLYYVYQNGQFQPLPTISPDDSLNPALTHVGNVDVATGKVSLYKDDSGTIYQLLIVQPPENFLNNPPMDFVNQNINSDQDYNPHTSHDFRHSLHGNSYGNLDHSRSSNVQDLTSPSHEQNTVFSAPDDSDDIEENLKDVVLPDENENSLNEDSIPPGERTLVKPKCPGSCLSSFMRFSCLGNHKIHDGFTCTSDTVCCASISDIEEHEQNLSTLSPFFNAPVENEENAKSCFNNWPKDFNVKEETLVSDYCWQVAIINEQNQYVCGGALIDNFWVLTAAHCVTGALKENKPLYVRAGVTDLTSAADNSAGQTRRALSIFVHHKHNSMSLDNDIAILRLQAPLHLNVNVCIACLPVTSTMPHNDSDCTVSGYGFLSKAGTMSLKLDTARISLIDDMECITNVTDVLSTVFILPASSFCAGGLGSNKACQGDAGAPLMCENSGRQELTGLVSWSLGCGQDEVPSIYVKIPMFMAWINQIINASTFLKALH